MKKRMTKTAQKTSLLLLIGMIAPALLLASDESERASPPPINPLMVIDTLKVAIEDLRRHTEDGTHTRFLRKATTLGKVRQKLVSFQKEYDETQERLGLLKDQRQEIADNVEGFVQALRRIHYARNRAGNALRNRIRTAYKDAGFYSRLHFESRIAREEETLSGLKYQIDIREALLEMNASFTQPSRQAILLEIEARHRSLDLTNPAVKRAVDEALEHVFCLNWPS